VGSLLAYKAQGVMRVRPEQIHNLAAAIVKSLVEKAFVRPRVDEKVLQERIAKILQENLEQEAALEAEAEEIAERHLRGNQELDRRKLILGIKARLAEERGFVL
jgi:hypothetical protein